MMRLDDQLREKIKEVVSELYNIATLDLIRIDTTPPEFEGQYTLVVFPFTKFSKKNPELTANEIAVQLKNKFSLIEKYNVVKGFLNISLYDSAWIEILNDIYTQPQYGKLIPSDKRITIEYCGPNTNKPLHLGHVRNMVLGYSVANILEAAGNEVHKVNIYNDRGIAICKSMVAYLKTGNNETPQSTAIKGDYFVGKYYLEYQKILEQEVGLLEMGNMSREEAEKKSGIAMQAAEMLRKWEAGDEEVLNLWRTMNSWVYEGLNETYKKIGVDFEKDYFESENYLKGKQLVAEGLNKNIFFKKEDGSVWIDLTKDGLDEKLLLRSDGTSVYITQDIAVARQRYKDFKMDTSVYVVANEQDYHFKVLKLVLQKLNEPYADGIYHLNYGMVDLPEGKMKSRQGTVVEADELIDEMIEHAKDFLNQSEKANEFTEQEKNILSKQIGLGALKYFILKIDPKKRIVFDPKESIDLHGHTGPFIQYTYARIQSVLRKAGENKFLLNVSELSPDEKNLIVLLYRYADVIKLAAENYSPAEIANYIYELAKHFNKFYAEFSIIHAESEEKKQLRLMLAQMVGKVLKDGLYLLGIESPEKM